MPKQMHARDPREPIFRKIGKRYVQCGTVTSPYLKGQLGIWEITRKDGLWLHTSGDSFSAMTFLSTLEDLPLPATQLAGLHLHKDAFVKTILKAWENPISAHELAEVVFDFVSKLQPEPCGLDT